MGQIKNPAIRRFAIISEITCFSNFASPWHRYTAKVNGRENEIRHCVACYEGCGMVTDQEGVVCIHNPAAGREERLGIDTLRQTQRRKRIIVVGAGIAGLKFAEIAAKRGHEVSIYEKTSTVGGQMLMAERIPCRAEQNEIYQHLATELHLLKVPVILNHKVDSSMIDSIKPDCVIIATGSDPTLPKIDVGGIDLIDPREAMQNPARIGKKAVVIDKIGYWQAMGVADYISEMGVELSIVSDRLLVGIDIVETCRENLNRRLARKNVRSYTSVRLKEIRGKKVVLENIFNYEECILDNVDTLIIAQESRSNNALYRELKSNGSYETYVLGDAAAPGTVLRIIFDAETLARRV